LSGTTHEQPHTLIKSSNNADAAALKPTAPMQKVVPQVINTSNKFDILAGSLEDDVADQTDLAAIAAGLQQPVSAVHVYVEDSEDDEVNEVHNETTDFLIHGDPNVNIGASTPSASVSND
jgi:phosphatidate phosphatase APP1